MNKIELTPQKLLEIDCPAKQLAELILLHTISGHERRISFRKEKDEIVATGMITKEQTIPIEPHIFGRIANHYRSLFGITYPSCGAKATITVPQGSAVVEFNLYTQRQEFIAELQLHSTQIDKEHSRCMLRRFYSGKRKQDFFIQRWWHNSIDWLHGSF